MKKATLILLLAGFTSVLSAQKTNTFEIGLKGAANSTWLFNNNISDQGDQENYAMAWGFNYGAGFSAYFGNIGFGLDALMGNHRGGYSGKYTIKDLSGNVISTSDYTSNVNLKTLQIPLMFKLKSESGGYIEVGPQYNLIQSADYHYSMTTPSMDSTYSVGKYYSSSYFSAVLGFGFKIKFGESPLSLSAGLRLNYSLTDLKGVDAEGRDLNNSLYYSKKAPTSAASGGILLGLIYTIGQKKS